MAWFGFTGLARHLNYKRAFPSLVSSVVRIPTFSLEAFDNTGTKIQPSSLLRLFESVRSHTFGKDEQLDFPNRSMLDLHKLADENFVFIACARLRFEKIFNQYESPKFPLYIRCSLQSMGSSSKTFLNELYHEGTDTLYATCEITDVLVSVKTRKPVGYPDWWIEKFAGHIESKKITLPESEDPQGPTFSSSASVRYSDTDSYRHANWTTFPKYCCDNIYEGMLSGAYQKLSKAHIDSGMHTMEVVYKSEANLGDKFDVLSWENPSYDHRIDAKVQVGNTACFYMNCTFFPEKKP